MELNSEIVAAWYSYDRLEDVAVKFGLTSVQLKDLWKKARQTGLLPTNVRRPRNESPIPARTPRKKVDPPLTDGTDGRPTVDSGCAHKPFPTAAERDPLLDALRREHGDDTINRDVVIAPARQKLRQPTW